MSMILKHQIDARSSNVQLVDAQLDSHDSPYEETKVNGKKQISPKQPQRKGGDND